MRELLVEVDDIERENILKFKRECAESNSDRGGMIGGRFSYRITPTGIGTAIVIMDSITGREENVTNYDRW